jgi:hypothetical protein
MATRKEAPSTRLKRRHALGLPTGRPRTAKTAAAPADGEHTVELDLRALDGETLARLREEDVARIDQEIAQRTATFEASIADLRLQRRRAVFAAREFRRADSRLATLMARAGMPIAASSTKRTPGESQPAQVLALAKAHPGDTFTKVSVAAALGLSSQSAACAISACFRDGTLERVSRGTYRYTTKQAAS